MIDLRSDTVTKACENMKKAMIEAEVGDDVLGDDPTVRKLESLVCNMFEMEAAVLCPSGTMANQLAVFSSVGPMDEVILEKNSHLYQFEVGGISMHSRASLSLIDGKQGKITAEEIISSINKKDIHKTTSKLVCLENTTNFGGGYSYSREEILSISEVCKKKNLKLHLDGARLFNAIVSTNIPAAFFGHHFDTISICLSKGLGAPIGSVLLGDKDVIDYARRGRKVFGGGMRQAGHFAAAGIYALEHNVERLERDHLACFKIYDALKKCSLEVKLEKPETNLLFLEIDHAADFQKLCGKLEAFGVLFSKISDKRIRFVFHKDVTGEMVSNLEQMILSF